MENDLTSIEQAITMLECAEVVQEFDQHVWVQISREDWEEFNKAFNKEESAND